MISVALRWLLGLLLVAVPFRCRAEPTAAASPKTTHHSSLTTHGSSIGPIELGFAGRFKLGYWTPLRITLEAGEETLAGDVSTQLVDGDELPYIVRHDDIEVSAGDKEVVELLVKPGRPRTPITVALETQETVRRILAGDDLPPPLLATQELFVEVGQPVGLDRLAQLYEERSLERPAAALVKSPAELPLEWMGYEGVDLVVITTSPPRVNELWTNDRLDALAQWVRSGGRLLLCVGKNAASVLKDSDGLARFVPGKFEQVQDRIPAPWESFAGALAEPMRSAAGGRAGDIPTAVLTKVEGQVDLADGRVPLVIRRPYGFGDVTFVAVDLDEPPFRDWGAQSRLLSRLLNRTEPTGTDTIARESAAQGLRLGYTDLAGQLRTSLNQFAEAPVVSFYLVAVLAVLYILLLFPIEFLIARRLRPKFETAWLLLPLVLLGSAGAIWYTADQTKGHELLANQLDVVDVDVGGGQVRGRSWYTLYSPRNEVFNLEAAPAKDLAPYRDVRLSWLGLPGTGLGGMNSPITNPAQFDQPYSIADEAAKLKTVPLAAWSTKSFEAAWLADLPPIDAALTERGNDRQPVGTLTNETGVPLADCVLLYGGWTYTLGSLQPGQSVNVARHRGTMSVTSYLTERRQIGEKEQATPYDPASDDLNRIARLIMFHDSAGGRRYTSLSNRYYHALDMTNLLRHGRALLLAKGPAASDLQIDSSQQRDSPARTATAFYRFVIPVTPEEDDEQLPTVPLRLKSP